MIALAACKKVERLPTTTEPAEPSPAVQPQQAAPQRAALPPLQVAPPVGCVADRVVNLAPAPPDIPDCNVDEGWCRTECTRGNAAACFALGAGMQNQVKDVALNLFAKSCELGLAIGCTNYGAGIWNDGTNSACAKRVFEKACSVKEAYACGMLGRMAVAAAKDDPARSAARAQLQKSCDELSGPPCKMLADHLKSGELGTYEPALIAILLKKACDGGDGLACDDLQKAGTGSN